MKSIFGYAASAFLVCSLFSGCQSQPASEDTAQRPINRMAADTFVELQRRNFNALERTAESLREKNVPLKDGQPALAGFYAGVSKCVQSRCGDERQSEAEWAAHARLLDEWIQAFPTSPTARLAKATFTKEYAWYVRGLGVASTVSESRWPKFNERIQQARSLLEAIGSEAENDPHWYATMLSIALVQGWPKDEFEKIYREGIKKFPYYTPLYFSKGSFVSPRWGGSQEDFNLFVEDSVRSTRNTMGETMYTRLHWSSWSGDMFRTGKTDWRRMKNGFSQITKDYPHPWNINNFAKFACMAGDAPVLAEQLAKINTTPMMEAWDDSDFLAACREFSAKANSK